MSKNILLDIIKFVFRIICDKRFLIIIAISYLIDLLINYDIKPYKIYGKNNKDTIILIHGLNDDSRCWNKQIQDLSSKYRLIVVDRTYRKTYMSEAEIYKIIIKTKTDGRLYCISASYGGVAAYNIQQKYNLFDKMIFMNLTWNPIHSFDYKNEGGFFIKYLFLYFIPIIICSYIPILNIYPLYLILALLGLPFFLLAILLDYLFYKRITYKDFYMSTYNLLTFTRTQRSSQGFAYFNLIRTISTNYHKTKPVNASKPVLNLVGESDNIGHFNSPNIEKILKSQHTKYELIKDGGHWFMKSKSHYINKRIFNFLE